MKYVTICFIGLGYQDKFQANIYLYDEDKLLFQEKTYNGKIKACLEIGKVYQLIAISANEIIKSKFYVSCKQRKYTFYFPRAFYRENGSIITFHLTDFYYKNLPIEKGEIILG